MSNINKNTCCPCEFENCQCIPDLPPEIPEKISRLSIKYMKNTLNRNKVTTIGRQTTDQHIQKLLNKHTRVLHIRLAYGTPDEHEQLMLKINNAIENFDLMQKTNYLPTPIGVAIEIRGHVRIGRLRNNVKSIRLEKNKEIALTANEAYRHSSVKEIIYLSKFDDYFDALQCGDYIFVNQSTVQLVIVKIVKTFQMVYCKIINGGHIQPYARITLPYHITNDTTCTTDELEDCSFALRHNADFIIIPSVTNGKYFQKIKLILENIKHYSKGESKVLANIDKYTLLNYNELHLNEIITVADGIWFDKCSKSMHDNMTSIVSMAVEQIKPVVCVTHKSICSICGGQNRRMHYEQITVHSMEPNERFMKLCKSMVTIHTPSGTNFIALSAFLLEAKLLIALTRTGHIPVLLTNAVNMCNIIAITRLSSIARQLTVWKNVLPVICFLDDDDYEGQLNFGLEYGKSLGLIKMGDCVGYCFDDYQFDCEEVPSVFRVIYVSS